MLRIEVVPCLEDNYAYIIITDKNEAIIVDAPEAEPIVSRINEQKLKPAAILITHHHGDHVQAVNQIDIGHVPIYGADSDAARLPHCDIWLKEKDHFKLAGLKFEVWPAYGHTIGHIAYYIPEANALFTGDSLMTWGCGRLFEGSPEQMWETLQSFAKLPPETMVYSGHNYGEVNGRFAISLGGYLDRMNERMEHVRGLNAESVPIVPVPLKVELETNPFLLAADDKYAKELGIADKTEVERFAHIRELRDNF